MEWIRLAENIEIKACGAASWGGCPFMKCTITPCRIDIYTFSKKENYIATLDFAMFILFVECAIRLHI